MIERINFADVENLFEITAFSFFFSASHLILSFIQKFSLPIISLMDDAFPPRSEIQEQRRALAEDTVSYAIYLRPTTEDTVANAQLPPNESSPAISASYDSAQVAKTLISSMVQEIAGDYIWHKDAFSLRIQSGKAPRKMEGLEFFFYVYFFLRY